MPLTAAERKRLNDRGNNSIGTVYGALFRDSSTNAYTTTIATLSTMNAVGHNFIAGVRVRFTTTGTLPTGLDTATTYRVINVSGNTFGLSLEINYNRTAKTGTAISTLSGGTGTHTVTEQALGEIDSLDVWVRWEAVYNGSARQAATIPAANDDNPSITPVVSFNFTPNTNGSTITYMYFGVIANGSATTGNATGSLMFFDPPTSGATTQTITAGGQIFGYQSRV
jgi:hypothetical protein